MHTHTQNHNLHAKVGTVQLGITKDNGNITRFQNGVLDKPGNITKTENNTISYAQFGSQMIISTRKC